MKAKTRSKVYISQHEYAQGYKTAQIAMLNTLHDDIEEYIDELIDSKSRRVVFSEEYWRDEGKIQGLLLVQCRIKKGREVNLMELNTL
jgi:hypothetical protein